MQRHSSNVLSQPSAIGTQHVALYARVSSDEQADRGTVQAQRDFLRNFCTLYDLDVISEYVDDGYSGTLPLADRPEGRRLLQDARARRFGVVVVYRIDRLGRSLRALLDAHAELEQAKVMIRSATEPLDTSTPMGRFVFQLLGGLAELERNTIQERMSMGRDRQARAGKWTGGTVPFGYDLDADQRLIPSMRLVESLGITEAELARSVFERMAAGSTSTAECQRLNALGVGTVARYVSGREFSKGSPWRQSRLTFMLKNPVYIGRHTLKSRFGAIEREVPALVDRQIWEAAQAQLARNRHLPKPNSTRSYLLRSLITCAGCGLKMVGAPGHGDNGWQSYYYRCPSQFSAQSIHRTGRPRCNAKNLPALWLEDVVWQDCADFARNPGKPLEEAQRQLRERLSGAANLDADRQRIQRQLDAKEAERERIMTLFRRGRATLADTERQLDAIQQESATLRADLEAMRAQTDLAAAFEAHYAQAAALLSRLSDRVDEIERGLRSDDPAIRAAAQAEQRSTVELLVSGIRVETHGAGRRKTATVHVDYAFGPPHVVPTKTACASRLCGGCPARGASWLWQEED